MRPAPVAWAKIHAAVVHSLCRVHSHHNLYIADGSVHVTNDMHNPVLMTVARAW